MGGPQGTLIDGRIIHSSVRRTERTDKLWKIFFLHSNITSTVHNGIQSLLPIKSNHLKKIMKPAKFVSTVCLSW